MTDLEKKTFDKVNEIIERDKLIDEMARDMCWEGADCSKCEGLLTCDKNYYAPRLVDKGYRKASDVAREIFEEIESCMVINQYKEFKILVDSYLTIKKKYTEVKE